MVRMPAPLLSIVGWSFVGLMSAYVALLTVVLFWVAFTL
jgi:hypothetical protein